MNAPSIFKEQVTTTTGESYSVFIGSELQNTFQEFWKNISEQQYGFVVWDENVKELHGDAIIKMLTQDAGLSLLGEYVVPPGEASKSWQHYKAIMDQALESGMLRNTPLIAIGGGVTGDLAGYAASSIMRGVPLIHIPTTLLAMVDSSIGGKTGINHRRGKNLIGAFYQPEGVLTDVSLLTTLDRRDWINGISEILKYGLIEDPDLFEKVKALDLEACMAQPEQMIGIIRQSIRIKAKIVELDTTESGLRAILNFGHTFGHALEAMGEYGELAHGEAVYAGMIAAIEASNLCGARIDPQKLLSFKDWYNLRLNKYENHIDDLIQLMRQDKKSTKEGIRLVLLQEWGSPYVAITDEQIIRKSFQRMFTSLS